MAEKIRHEGIVERVEPSHLQVRIVQASACAACGAKGLCKAAESKEKLGDVVYKPVLVVFRSHSSVLVSVLWKICCLL